jgi:hypothetical protein
MLEGDKPSTRARIERRAHCLVLRVDDALAPKPAVLMWEGRSVRALTMRGCLDGIKKNPHPEVPRIPRNGPQGRRPALKITMPAHTVLLLAALVLAFHVAVILFNLFGMVAVPLGHWRGWRFVRIRWWRALHLAALAAVAAQALLGRACFLTLWQQALRGMSAGGTPLIMTWVNRLLFWPLPIWFFAALYVLVFLYVLLLWRLVPPAKWDQAGSSGSGSSDLRMS